MSKFLSGTLKGGQQNKSPFRGQLHKTFFFLFKMGQPRPIYHTQITIFTTNKCE